MMGKRVLFDVGHPAQVHQFKYVHQELIARGWNSLFTAKEKEISTYLLEKYEIPFENLGLSRKGLASKVRYLPKTLWHFLKILDEFKPDIVISRFSPHASWGAFLKNIPHIGLTDTEHVGLLDKLTVPFVDVKLTAKSYWKDIGKNHFRYSGNIELFYLHPHRFQPQRSFVDEYLNGQDNKNVIVRFVSWNAHHDVGKTGLTVKQKMELVNALSPFARIFITSEASLPPELEKFKISIPPEKIHHFLSSCSLYIGEGGTMASESACLGIPAIYVNSLDAGVFHDEAKHGLLYHIQDVDQVIEKSLLILNDSQSLKKFASLRDKYLADKIDITAFLVWFIEQYPDSVQVMRENPQFQYRFK